MPDPDETPPMTDPAAPLVLVVDDDDSVRDVVCRSLEHAGIAVRQADSGRRALAMLREGVEVTAVVTDLKMDEGSGGWLVAQLAYEYPRLLPHVIVISGNAESTAAAHVAARWRCPVLAKPFTVAE